MHVIELLLHNLPNKRPSISHKRIILKFKKLGKYIGF